MHFCSRRVACRTPVCAVRVIPLYMSCKCVCVCFVCGCLPLVACAAAAGARAVRAAVAAGCAGACGIPVTVDGCCDGRYLCGPRRQRQCSCQQQQQHPLGTTARILRSVCKRGRRRTGQDGRNRKKIHVNCERERLRYNKRSHTTALMRWNGIERCV